MSKNKNKPQKLSPLTLQKNNESLYNDIETTMLLDNSFKSKNTQKILAQLRNRLKIKTKPSFMDSFL